MNVIEQMITDKIAKNVFQATHIANGLKLYELADDAAKIERYKLYRKWRDAGEISKIAYAKAIEGNEPLELFESGASDERPERTGKDENGN